MHQNLCFNLDLGISQRAIVHYSTLIYKYNLKQCRFTYASEDFVWVQLVLVNKDGFCLGLALWIIEHTYENGDFCYSSLGDAAGIYMIWFLILWMP